MQRDGVEVVHFVRKMRGYTQAHLLRARDEQTYVVKFRNNPQGRRVLVNEWVTSELLQASGIQTPQATLVHVTPEFLELNPAVHLRDGNERVAVEPGVHFGSQYPGDAASTVVYDFLPDAMLSQVDNLEDFLRVLVFDKWLGNTDGRQCVFYRQPARVSGSDTKRVRWVASMIDHGLSFNGGQWNFPDCPIHGLYGRGLVYNSVRSLDDFEPWLEELSNVTEDLIARATTRMPAEWVENDGDGLKRLLDHLFQRRTRVPELLKACCQNAPNSFPRWSPAIICSVPTRIAASVVVRPLLSRLEPTLARVEEGGRMFQWRRRAIAGLLEGTLKEPGVARLSLTLCASARPTALYLPMVVPGLQRVSAPAYA